MEDNYQIQILAETKDFAALTTAEQAMVLQHITRRQYDARRALILNTRASFQQQTQELKPDASIRLLVAARLAAQKDTQHVGIWQQLLHYRIPAYIPAMAFIILLIVAPLYYNHTQQQLRIAEARTTPQVIYKTKTVTVEKEVPKYVSVPIIKYVKQKEVTATKTSKPPITAMTAEQQEQMPATAHPTFTPQQWQSQKRARMMARL